MSSFSNCSSKIRESIIIESFLPLHKEYPKSLLHPFYQICVDPRHLMRLKLWWLLYLKIKFTTKTEYIIKIKRSVSSPLLVNFTVSHLSNNKSMSQMLLSIKLTWKIFTKELNINKQIKIKKRYPKTIRDFETNYFTKPRRISIGLVKRRSKQAYKEHSINLINFNFYITCFLALVIMLASINV